MAKGLFRKDRRIGVNKCLDQRQTSTTNYFPTLSIYVFVYVYYTYIYVYTVNENTFSTIRTLVIFCQRSDKTINLPDAKDDFDLCYCTFNTLPSINQTRPFDRLFLAESRRHATDFQIELSTREKFDRSIPNSLKFFPSERNDHASLGVTNYAYLYFTLEMRNLVCPSIRTTHALKRTNERTKRNEFISEAVGKNLFSFFLIYFFPALYISIFSPPKNFFSLFLSFSPSLSFYNVYNLRKKISDTRCKNTVYHVKSKGIPEDFAIENYLKNSKRMLTFRLYNFLQLGKLRPGEVLDTKVRFVFAITQSLPARTPFTCEIFYTLYIYVSHFIDLDFCSYYFYTFFCFFLRFSTSIFYIPEEFFNRIPN